MHTRSARRIYNREYIKPFGFRSIFTILQLFFYVSKKKLIFRHWKKPFSIFFLFFFLLFSPPRILLDPSLLYQVETLLEIVVKIKRKRELFLLQNTSRWPISSVGCLFSARPSSKRSLSVETSHERSVKPRSRDSNARLVHEFSCFRSAASSVGKLSQRKWSNAPGEFNNRGGEKVDTPDHFYAYLEIIGFVVENTRLLGYSFHRLPFSSNVCDFFFLFPSNDQLLFPFLSFSTKNNNRFDRYRMTVFIVFKGNFISSLIPVNAPRFFSPLTSIITIGLKLP